MDQILWLLNDIVTNNQQMEIMLKSSIKMRGNLMKEEGEEEEEK